MSVNVVVEPKLGASGTIAMAHLARVNPDGYTLAVGTNTTLTSAPHLYKSPGYDVGKSFTYLGVMFTTRQMLVVSPKLNVGSLRELIALAKSRPGQLNFGSPGLASGAHLAAEHLCAAAGMQAVHVPYRSGTDVETAILAGDVHFTFNSLSVSIGLVKSGRLRALALTGSGRDPRLADVPTLEEEGFKDLISDQFYGILAPANLPSDVEGRLTAGLRNVALDPAYQEALRKTGADPSALNAAQFRNLVERDSRTWGALIRRLNVAQE